jgi:hypothetical protein
MGALRQGEGRLNPPFPSNVAAKHNAQRSCSCYAEQIRAIIAVEPALHHVYEMNAYDVYA